MAVGALHSLRGNQTWPYALLGGIVSIPLVLADYWLSGMGSYFSINMVFFGGLLAGFLAQRGSANTRQAATGAGIIGGLPGYLWILPAMGQMWTSFATAWSSPLAATVLVLLGSVLMVGISAVAGLLGGIVGSWLAKNVNGNLPGAVSR
ncbi:hypothetical protein J2754_003035 [Halarchaeum solikamskense]|uniref:DUF5518 domain-containing protein n=1 Tax=Halarchaeum nitratireducens TaxID=489913 RepID=UPI001B3A9634|nr:DUF5518 domain-containing protein [Halarchaeum solikamskense]MBP2252689.1 hypothetical protein [Halarchaeum solikamskense]